MVAFPTDRIAFDKQVEILRAFAIAAGNTDDPVTNNDVAELVGLADGTVSLNNTFLTDIKLLAKTDKGAFLPSPEVREFRVAYEWDPETAGHKLQPRLEDSWFARALIPRLEMQKRVSRKQAIAVMAQAAGVDQKQANKLSMLVDWLEFAGLVQVDESDMVSLPRTPAAEPTRPTKTEHQTADREQRRTTAPTTTSQGGVNLNFAVRVDITELAARINESPQRRDLRVVPTGTSSIAAYAVMARQGPVAFYCTDLDALRRSDILRASFEETERFPNVVLEETRDDTVYFDVRRENGAIRASPIQTYLELMAGDKRDRETAVQVADEILTSAA